MPKIYKTPRPNFQLNNNYNRDSNNPDDELDTIRMVVSYRRKRLTLGLGRQIIRGHWNSKEGRALYPRKIPANKSLNLYLDHVEKVVSAVFDRMPANKYDLSEIKLELKYCLGFKERPVELNDQLNNLLAYVPYFIEHYAPTSQATKFQTTGKHLEAFANSKKGTSLEWDQLDRNFEKAFTKYLEQQELTDTYITKLWERVRRLIRTAHEEDELHTNINYTRFHKRVKTIRAKQLALSELELLKIRNLDLSDNLRLDRVRDLFLIGAFTGLRYSDFSRLTPRHFVNDGDGDRQLVILNKKTKKKTVIPLLFDVDQILEKYDYKPPKISNQKMNDYLKEIGQLAGLTDELERVRKRGGKEMVETLSKADLLTTHVARRSFATNLYLRGFPVAEIKELTGHGSEAMFMRYIQMDGHQNARNVKEKFNQQNNIHQLKTA